MGAKLLHKHVGGDNMYLWRVNDLARETQLRDVAYDFIGRVRYRLEPRLSESCQLRPHEFTD